MFLSGNNSNLKHDISSKRDFSFRFVELCIMIRVTTQSLFLFYLFFLYFEQSSLIWLLFKKDVWIGLPYARFWVGHLLTSLSRSVNKMSCFYNALPLKLDYNRRQNDNLFGDLIDLAHSLETFEAEKGEDHFLFF